MFITEGKITFWKKVMMSSLHIFKSELNFFLEEMLWNVQYGGNLVKIKGLRCMGGQTRESSYLFWSYTIILIL